MNNQHVNKKNMWEIPLIFDQYYNIRTENRQPFEMDIKLFRKYSREEKSKCNKETNNACYSFSLPLLPSSFPYVQYLQYLVIKTL